MAVIQDHDEPGQAGIADGMAACPAVVCRCRRQAGTGQAGGFRLDDPAGEVGIEFMAVTGRSGVQAAAYLVPMTYRRHALASASRALIGTAHHGSSGAASFMTGTCATRTWSRLMVALIQGQAKAQMQNVSDTPTPP